MKLDRGAAERAIMTHIGEPLGLDLLEAARGIITIVDAQMSLSVRAVSIEKGEDPREFALVPTGGAGPVHALSLARELKIGTVIVPILPGQFSAKGMLYSEVRHDLTRTQILRFGEASAGALADTLAALEIEAWERLSSDIGTKQNAAIVKHFLELRYVGQEFTIAVPVPEGGLNASTYQEIRDEFDSMHEHLYGHKAPNEPVETSGARTVISMPLIETVLVEERAATPKNHSSAGPIVIERRSVVQHGGHGLPVDCPVYDRDSLVEGDSIEGPAVIQEATSSVVIYGGDVLEVARDLSLVISVGSFA
jgi:N-methylhydantoinase A